MAAPDIQSYDQYEVPTPPHRMHRSIVLLPPDKRDPNIDLENIQGDIYPTFPKKAEALLFFVIKDPQAFKTSLGNFIPHITTAAKVAGDLDKIKELKVQQAKTFEPAPLLPMEQLQIAISKASFPILGITGGINDPDFDRGPQINEALDDLGDRRVPGSDVSDRILDWEDVWKDNQVHGVIVIATESDLRCKKVRDLKIKSIFGDSIDIINVVEGKAREGNEKGHEHFGFLDGISQPAIRGLAEPHKGQLQCAPGVIIMGHEGDPMASPAGPTKPPRPVGRPEWVKDGSIMVFRKLKQYVPEFNRFLKDNPITYGGLTRKQGSELLGARMFGRWKSGAPIDKLPLRDDHPNILDVDRINNFDYSVPEPGDEFPGQTRCPFIAHSRKMAPRKGSPLHRRLLKQT